MGKLVKRIAVYGDFETIKWVYRKQPVWIMRRDGIRQRYWKYKTVQIIITDQRGRYEFYGRGRDLAKAVRLAHRYMPDGYIEVDALDFLENPSEYGTIGQWVWRDIES